MIAVKKGGKKKTKIVKDKERNWALMHALPHQVEQKDWPLIFIAAELLLLLFAAWWDKIFFIVSSILPLAASRVATRTRSAPCVATRSTATSASRVRALHPLFPVTSTVATAVVVMATTVIVSLARVQFSNWEKKKLKNQINIVRGII